MDKLDEQVRFMAQAKINTEEDLDGYLKILESDIEELVDERSYLKREIKKEVYSSDFDEPDTDFIQGVNDRLYDIETELKRLRKEARLCREIKKRSPQLEENLQILQQEEETERKEREDELLRRSGRSGRSDIAERG